VSAGYRRLVVSEECPVFEGQQISREFDAVTVEACAADDVLPGLAVHVLVSNTIMGAAVFAFQLRTSE